MFLTTFLSVQNFPHSYLCLLLYVDLRVIPVNGEYNRKNNYKISSVNPIMKVLDEVVQIFTILKERHTSQKSLRIVIANTFECTVIKCFISIYSQSS